ncbi:hypothetical protein [Methanobrevibacter sp.]
MNGLRQLNLDAITGGLQFKKNEESEPRYLWYRFTKKESEKMIKIKLTEEALTAKFQEVKIEKVNNNEKKTVVESSYEEKDRDNDLEYSKLKRYADILDQIDRIECENVMMNMMYDFIEAKIENRIEFLVRFIETYFEELGYGKKEEFNVSFKLI